MYFDTTHSGEYHCALMSNQAFPARINPRKWAEKGSSWTGELPLSQFTRLTGALQDSEGQVKASVEFGVDEERIRYMKCDLSASVKMTCQRCLTPVELTVETSCSLGIVWHEEAAENLPSHYDPMIVSEETAEILPVLEDELIISLPIVPVHEDCTVQTEFSDPDEPILDDRPASNPFDVLAQLKLKK
ncbi:YceD family protein [Pokkaliibacter sp. CJK22405]|uniref:YceD family protein n=1 Tax=Pokkaliibacter sp. CJK22405 TaxID=3384615 RepID=UPI003984F567